MTAQTSLWWVLLDQQQIWSHGRTGRNLFSWPSCLPPVNRIIFLTSDQGAWHLQLFREDSWAMPLQASHPPLVLSASRAGICRQPCENQAGTGQQSSYKYSSWQPASLGSPQLRGGGQREAPAPLQGTSEAGPSFPPSTSEWGFSRPFPPWGKSPWWSSFPDAWAGRARLSKPPNPFKLSQSYFAQGMMKLNSWG